MNTVVSFPPVSDKNARVLILGSIPGEESLKKNQYYAHPCNSFWYIVLKMLNDGVEVDYDERKEILKENRIALWDVLKACVREGSLDSSIESSSIVTNDFESFYSEYPDIRYVFFNGAKAEKEYRNHVLPKVSKKYNSLKYYQLPSTGPAMTRLTKEEKLSKWLIIKQNLTMRCI
jgi:hypoxanthine-DNA glycosylase